jgi:Holliday junction resolvasome RuvABC endonuclease subunit
MGREGIVRVAGLDLSITETGLVVSGFGSGLANVHTIKSREPRDWRLVEIRREVRALLDGAELALLEDLPVHVKASGITGMVQGVVRVELMDLGIKYGLVVPATLKKYATGRGNATKPDMAVAAHKRAEMEFRNDNECDAWWLWVMANDHADQAVFTLPKDQRASLDKIKWEG